MNRGLYSVSPVPKPLDMFAQLLAQAPFAVWVADKTGKVILFNETMRAMVDGEPAKILKKYNLFEDPIAVSQGLVPHIKKKVLEGQLVQTVVMLDLSREHFDGDVDPKVIYARCLYFPLKNDGSSYEYIVMLVENITQQYLEDLTLSKMAREVERAHDEIIRREQEMSALKKRLETLARQLASLKK